MSDGTIAAASVVANRVRAYFAPVNRDAGVSTIFDPAESGRFDVDAGLGGWTSLGDVSAFTRLSETIVAMERSGSPLITKGQARTAVDALVSFEFEVWGKLQMGLSCGSQHMNLLPVTRGATANGSGGRTSVTAAVLAGSTGTALNVGVTAAATFRAGDMVAVDVDYAGQTGYVGSGVSAAYVRSIDKVQGDAHYVRRVSYNVGLVVSVAEGVLTLSHALAAGVPSTQMKVAKVLGFVDREGGTFFLEWSALFVVDGVQGDRVIYHYPRLQAAKGAAEAGRALGQSGLESWRLLCMARALPVVDANDSEAVVCFRSYLPAAMREV